MKFFTLLWIFIISVSAKAASIELRCHSPSTVFEIQGQDGEVTSRLTHPMGIEYTPMFAGNLPIVGIQQVLAQAEIVKKLGNSQIFAWPKEKCSMDENHILYCSNGKPVVINGVKIRPILLRSSNSHLTISSGEFEVFNISLIFLVEDETVKSNGMFTLNSNYSFARDCQ